MKRKTWKHNKFQKQNKKPETRGHRTQLHEDKIACIFQLSQVSKTQEAQNMQRTNRQQTIYWIYNL